VLRNGSLRYGFDVSSFLSSLMNLGEVCWRYHQYVSTSLQADVGVMKDSSAYLSKLIMLYELLLVSCLLMIEIDTMHWVGRQ